MSRSFFSRHRLLFRSYLFLAAGLLVVAAVLDFGLSRLQSGVAAPEDPWIEATFELVEARLAAVPVSQREVETATIGDELGFRVTFLAADDVAASGDSAGTFQTLVDADGQSSYLMYAADLGGHLRLGPFEEQGEGTLGRLLPPIFYLSIFVLVGLWLRPLLKELRLITSASQRFAADYREPLRTADDATQLEPLARNLDEMSARLSGLIQTQKELIAALSHEMRTPLARIRMALAVLGDRSDEDATRDIDAIVRDVEDIDELIGSMLSYARLDHPDLNMNWQSVPIEAWLEHVADRCRRPDRSMSIELGPDIGDVDMDPRLMELAVSNLLANAGKYATNDVRVSMLAGSGGHQVIVEDDGPGIAETDREAVFKAFSRVDDSRNRETGGYGLGLAIVARIAALHGGSVQVDTSENLGGARFILQWPDRS